jgi:hypothetical protein
MSLTRTSCDNSMHYYSFISPSPAMAPFASSSLSSLPTKASLWIFSPHITTLSRVCPFLFLSSLLAANVVALSFLPTSLAAYILFWGEIFPFLDGIIWFIILLFFARPNFYQITFDSFRVSGSLVRRPVTPFASTNCQSSTSEYPVSCAAHTETRRLRFLKQQVLLVLFTNTFLIPFSILGT